jgi:hypothetical protein
MVRRVRERPGCVCWDLRTQRRRTMSRRQRNTVCGLTNRRSPTLGDDGEQQRDQRPVGPRQLRSTVDLALQHPELMAQQQDLRRPPRLLTTRQAQPPKQPADHQETQSQTHDPRSSQDPARRPEAGAMSTDEVFGTHRCSTAPRGPGPWMHCTRRVPSAWPERHSSMSRIRWTSHTGCREPCHRWAATFWASRSNASSPTPGSSKRSTLSTARHGRPRPRARRARHFHLW